MSAIIFSRTIGPVPIDCMVRESMRHEVVKSRVPIESGANITDHAYIEPKGVRLEVADGAGAATWAALTAFQEARVPFTMVTGLYVYPNMMITRMQADRSAEFAYILNGFVELEEAIIVETAYAAAEDGDPVSNAQPGGANSTRSASPTSGRAGDAATANRASGTVMRGDAATKTVPSSQGQSILKSLF